MSRIIALIVLIVLVMEAVVITFFFIIALNGFPSLPNGFVAIYLVCMGGFLLGLSLLGGFLAKKLSEISPLPLWLAGILTTIVNLVILPILSFVLMFSLLVGFGMM